MLTWAFFWYHAKVKTEEHADLQLSHIVPMGCDVAIFYCIAEAFRRCV